jgi:glutamine synthetase adenylyltransferase
MNAAAVTYQQTETKITTERLPKKTGIIDCEIIAIILAIQHKSEEPKLLIMSDNQTALEYCEYAQRKGKLAQHNRRFIQALRKFEGKIQTSYVPAHTSIE